MRAEVRACRSSIAAALGYRLANARVESCNARIRRITRPTLGCRSAEAQGALTKVSLGGLRPALPGR
jgi:transposase